MPVLAVLAWLAPPAVLGVITWRSLASPRVPMPGKNACATGTAAAGMVLVFFWIHGVAAKGPLDGDAVSGWAWRIPCFAALAAGFAWASGWACASLYLALREYLRGRARQAGCPSPLHTALAFAVLLALVVFYLELARDWGESLAAADAKG